MLIECDACAVQGLACQDCVVSVMLGPPASAERPVVDLDGAEQAAIAVLASSGLVPPLRLLPLASPSPTTTAGGSGRTTRRHRAAG